jgi:uncharacterized protein (TIGR02246 family)
MYPNYTKYVVLLMVVFLAIIAFFVITSPTAHHIYQCAAAERSTIEIENTFHKWVSALNSGKSDQVVKLYAKDATLLPTLSPKILTTHQQIKQYFDMLAGKPNIKVVVDKLRVSIIGNIAFSNGLYTISYTENGHTISVPARFSFVYQHRSGQWLIIDHHSSVLPTA